MFTGQLARGDWNPSSSSSSPSIIPLLTIPSFWRWSHARPALGLRHQNYINKINFPCIYKKVRNISFQRECCNSQWHIRITWNVSILLVMWSSLFCWWPGHWCPATPGWPVLLRSRLSPSLTAPRPSHSFVRAWHHHDSQEEVWPRPGVSNTENRKARKNLNLDDHYTKQWKVHCLQSRE